MSAPCFPYGFQTGTARSPRGVDRIWARYTNAEPGTFGHEYEEPAAFFCASADSFQSCFCAECNANGSDARRFTQWKALPLIGRGAFEC
jgi:hypothetical protein